ncbi:MAG: bifunctional phosphoribosyl-AMP cyclohydrolase/phosphoribosyl-ATP diphosphatase HisIE [Candidatus Marinimicrobia bacterium]|nr:bifunctional phosphoribosyl-AMP cyclohydrolase/phosphoribosyl-ATP diphosphatase HisIE [Candidatus Neomarinimicrobiota bacterium]
MKMDFNKNNGLIPAIIQDEKTGKVLMLGYMNEESLARTQETGKVTFFSRSRQELWTKGETSGNYLFVRSMAQDCDEDTLLIKVDPVGPVCHTGTDTCFNEINSNANFLFYLESVIDERRKSQSEKSYTASLFKKGINKIAQKVGEEATETIIEALNGSKELLKEETADLLFHLLVLLRAKEVTLAEVLAVLEKRHQ